MVRFFLSVLTLIGGSAPQNCTLFPQFHQSLINEISFSDKYSLEKSESRLSQRQNYYNCKPYNSQSVMICITMLSIL